MSRTNHPPRQTTTPNWSSEFMRLYGFGSKRGAIKSVALRWNPRAASSRDTTPGALHFHG